MPYKINNIHAVDNLIRKIRPTLAASKLKKLSDRGKAGGPPMLKVHARGSEKKESFQQKLKKALAEREGRSWRA